MNEDTKVMTAIEIYESMSKPPTYALKKITGGRLKGMTDVKPQWRIEALTKQYGLCGIGWKYTIDKLWIEKGAKDEVLAFSQISLYVKSGEQWSDAIPGLGGSMLIADEQRGLHNSDEAYKMATTDALSVACKMIGIAASIYMGEWTGSKYNDHSDTTGEKAVQKQFGQPDEEQHIEGEQFTIGQEVPPNYWKLNPDQKKSYMPKGTKATKNPKDNKWYVVPIGEA
jgi:hypothetical protein